MGIFVTFEGIDGVGKSTQAKKLKEYFETLGLQVIHTCEPGGTRVGQEIRKLLLDPDFQEIHQQTEILLYAADRAQHVQETIKPALDAGKVVICERYVDSSIAYQGYGLGYSLDAIKEINKWATSQVFPVLTLCLDMEPKLALEKTGGDRIEQRTIDYYERVRNGFMELAREEAERFYVVSAHGTIQEVQERIYQIVKRRLDL